MRLLDLFCGAGGAAMGYHRAGFEVVGVDHKPQPRFPFEFHCADAFAFLEKHGHEFDVIHASPPCQAHTALRTAWNAKQHDDLLTPMRKQLIASGHTYIVENVPGAPLSDALVLCGTMFGLGTGNAELRRHRLFESNTELGLVYPCSHGSRVIGVYGGYGRNRVRTIGVYGGGHGESLHRAVKGQRNYTAAEQREAMGIDWMTVDELSQAIPPAYTEFIGRRLVEASTNVHVEVRG